MAQDIIPLDPIKDKCPWCGKPVLIEHSLAVYEGGESTEQYDGLEKNGAIEDREQKAIKVMGERGWLPKKPDIPHILKRLSNAS